MPEIHIMVSNKIATGDGSRIVCGNSDYMAVFSFDEEWAAHDVKTARFVYPGGAGDHIDVIFEGNTCPVPVLHNTIGVKVGVFAGELHTTTSAWFDCKKSVLCESGGSPVPSSPDVYAQLLEKISNVKKDTTDAFNASMAAAKASGEFDGMSVLLYEGDNVGVCRPGYAYNLYVESMARYSPKAKLGDLVLTESGYLLRISYIYPNYYIGIFVCSFVGTSVLYSRETGSGFVEGQIVKDFDYSSLELNGRILRDGDLIIDRNGNIFLVVYDEGTYRQQSVKFIGTLGIGGAASGSLPAGDTPGQVLTKTENGAEWADMESGGGIRVEDDGAGNVVVTVYGGVSVVDDGAGNVVIE